MATSLKRRLAFRIAGPIYQYKPRFVRMVHHHIVALEAVHCPMPTFSLPTPNTSTIKIYDRTSNNYSELHPRVHDATVLIICIAKLDAHTLSPTITPNLQHIAVMASGTDSVDLEACKKRDIRVTNCPHANVETVAEHAIGLYFAARRSVVRMHGEVVKVPSEWKAKLTVTKHMRDPEGRPPLNCRDEVVGIVGYGAVGKAIAKLARALGMTVLVAERKGGVPSSNTERNDRTPFKEVLRKSTVLMLCCPRTPSTLNLISHSELQMMSRHSVLINVSRGGIVDEAALVQALREGQIAGAATDVFEKEPVEGDRDSPLLSEEVKALNLTFSPHVAWFGERTLANHQSILKENVEGWVVGREQNVVA